MKGLLPLQLILYLLQWQSVSSSWYCRYQSLSPPCLNKIFRSYFLVFGKSGVTPHRLYRGSLTLNNNKASQETHLPVRVVKENAEYFAEINCSQFNESINSSKFPLSFE